MPPEGPFDKLRAGPFGGFDRLDGFYEFAGAISASCFAIPFGRLRVVGETQTT